MSPQPFPPPADGTHCPSLGTRNGLEVSHPLPRLTRAMFLGQAQSEGDRKEQENHLVTCLLRPALPTLDVP